MCVLCLTEPLASRQLPLSFADLWQCFIEMIELNLTWLWHEFWSCNNQSNSILMEVAERWKWVGVLIRNWLQESHPKFNLIVNVSKRENDTNVKTMFFFPSSSDIGTFSCESGCLFFSSLNCGLWDVFLDGVVGWPSCFLSAPLKAFWGDIFPWMFSLEDGWRRWARGRVDEVQMRC